MFIDENGIFLEIIDIQTKIVDSNELISLYTTSGTLLANGVLASTKSEDDASEYYIPVLSFINSYISNEIP